MNQVSDNTPKDTGTDGEVVTIASRVFNRIRAAIVEGEIKAGSKISEPELANAFGISRGPLREAIGRLEACGLVVRKPNVGARVVKLSPERMVQMYHVREVLEGLAARLAAIYMTDEEIEELMQLLDAHRSAIASAENRAYNQKEGDVDFHYRIIKGSRNERLVELLCNDLYHQIRMYRCQYGMPSRRAPRAFEEHQHIAEAIARRDAELAELLMRHHIRASRENTEKLLLEQTNHDDSISR